MLILKVVPVCVAGCVSVSVVPSLSLSLSLLLCLQRCAPRVLLRVGVLACVRACRCVCVCLNVCVCMRVKDIYRRVRPHRPLKHALVNLDLTGKWYVLCAFAFGRRSQVPRPGCQLRGHTCVQADRGHCRMPRVYGTFPPPLSLSLCTFPVVSLCAPSPLPCVHWHLFLVSVTTRPLPLPWRFWHLPLSPGGRVSVCVCVCVSVVRIGREHTPGSGVCVCLREREGLGRV